jgi:hypothetical protein
MGNTPPLPWLRISHKELTTIFKFINKYCPPNYINYKTTYYKKCYQINFTYDCVFEFLERLKNKKIFHLKRCDESKSYILQQEERINVYYRNLQKYFSQEKQKILQELKILYLCNLEDQREEKTKGLDKISKSSFNVLHF